MRIVTHKSPDARRSCLTLHPYTPQTELIPHPQPPSKLTPPAQCLNEWAIDYFEEVLMPLDNYISQDTETFLNTRDPDLLALTNQVNGLGGVLSWWRGCAG